MLDGIWLATNTAFYSKTQCSMVNKVIKYNCLNKEIKYSNMLPPNEMLFSFYMQLPSETQVIK